MRPRGRRLLFWAGLLLVVLAAGCRKSPEDWVDDILHGDEFERQMAVIALREVEDDQVRYAMRAALAAMLDRRPSVIDSAGETLVALAHRDLEGFLPIARHASRQGLRWREACCDVLLNLDARATPRLLEVLCDPRDPLRVLVAEIMRQQGPEAVERAHRALAQAGVPPPDPLRD